MKGHSYGKKGKKRPSRAKDTHTNKRNQNMSRTYKPPMKRTYGGR